MMRFFALLALVSGLILADSAMAADETEKWCVTDRIAGEEIIAKITEQGFPVRELDATNTAIFLSHVNKSGFIPDMPMLPGVTMKILINPGVAIWGMVFKDDKWCARLQLGWEDYQSIVNAMRPKNI